MSICLRSGLRQVIAALALVSAAPVASGAAGVARADCFPLEQLPPDLRQKSEALLLRALDTEALYTFVGDLKPMSSFTELRVPLDKLDLATVEATRRALRAWRCGDDYFADVHHFVQPHDNRLYLEGAIWNRITLGKLIAQHEPYFKRFGLTPSSHPMEVTMAVEYDTAPERFRGYGYLYGYPDYAVDFFVDAENQRKKTGRSVPRDIVSMPTYARSAQLYAWTVPKGHQENDVDERIRRQVLAILNDYLARRPKYIGAGKPGVVALLRDWLDDGKGRCSAANVTVRY